MKYILVDKKPVAEPDLMKWSEWIETAKRSLGYDVVGEIELSTIFFGIDMGIPWMTHDEPNYEPLVFETMAFYIKDGDIIESFQQKYCTYKEAENGHAEILEILKEYIEVDGNSIIKFLNLKIKNN